MDSRQPLFELAVGRAAKGSRAATSSLHEQLRAAIVAGRLRAGARLPASRQAPRLFGVSRNTAAEAYARLASEGFVVARRGAGTFVADALPTASRPRRRPTGAPDPRLNPFWLDPDVATAIGFWHVDAPDGAARADARRIDFRPALVDARFFPHDVYRRIVARQLRNLETRPASLRSPQGNQGSFALRDAVVRHIAVTRAVACDAEDVLVTAGAQQAFDVLARTLVVPGRTVVAVENPGYPPMRVAFAAAGARIVPVDVDADGLVVDRLPHDVRIVCVTPSHQFPMGVSMSPARRRALVAFARAHDAVVVEDDYDGEFRLDGDPLGALRAIDAADVVFYVGTFSKCMLPAFRIGFVVAPDWAMRALVTAKNAMDWHCPTPLQASIAAFVSEGHLTRHVRAMRARYRERRDAFVDAVRDTLAGRLAPLPSHYGMHATAVARPDADVEAAVRDVARHDVKIHSLRRYFVGEPTANGLVFGFGTTDVPAIRRGVALVAKSLR